MPVIQLTHSVNETNDKVNTGQVSLTSADGIATYALTQPVPVADINNRKGWLWTKGVVGATEFLTYYFYTEGNSPVLLGDVASINAILSVDTYTTTQSVPILNIYTKPTGVGDAGAWFHSRINYTLTAGEPIILGERIEMWGINQDKSKGVRQVNSNTQVKLGDCLDGEEVLTMSVIMETASPNGARVLVENAGYKLNNGIRIGVEYSV